MYAVIDDDKIIAIHDEKRVVKTYIDRIKENCGKELVYGKLKKKHIKSTSDLYDLYLVKYGSTYVQSSYLEFVELADPQIIYDYQYAKDVILKMLEIDYLDQEDRKTLEKSVMIIENIIHNDEKYTPTIEELERLRDQYAPYLYNKEFWR